MIGLWFRGSGVSTLIGVALVSVVLLAVLDWVEAPVAIEISNGLHPPSWTYPMGTDRLGRDVFIRSLFAAGLSLSLAALATLAAFLIGVVMALVSAANAGKWMDRVIVLLADGMRSFPSLVLALLFVTSGLPIALLLALYFWTAFWRTLRSQLNVEACQSYALVARLLGLSEIRVLAGEALPNALTTARSYFVVIFAEVLSVQSSLEFLGFGPPLNTPSLGGQLSEALQLPQAYWIWLPSLLIIFIVVGLSVYATLGNIGKSGREANVDSEN
ncbi:MAG: ABC transporter permease subunit [Candidatus Thiodiazotropha endolucinida]